MTITLRDYQLNCIQSVFRYWSMKRRRGLCVVSTGAGKSAIIAALCKEIIDKWPTTRILVVTDSKEIVSQNRAELLKYWPEADTGIYSAGLGERNTTAQIIFAGVQSIYRHLYELYPALDLIICDECHCIPRDADTRYGELIKNATAMNPKVEILGFTATPFRLDSGELHKGEGALFEGIAYSCDIKKLIDNGYLSPVISKGGLKSIDLSNVHIRGGEFVADELARAADDPELIRLAVDDIVKCGESRNAWLIFAAGVEHAYHVNDELLSRGIQSEVVTGETPTKQRDELIKRFREGNLKCLINVAVLTKGFNAPRCDLIAMLTATQSTGKYAQIVGRGMRTFPGKDNCLLLDYGQNVLTHGEIDNLRPMKKGSGGNGEQPLKQCPECNKFLPISTRVCSCGYEYPEHECLPCHGTTAYSGAVLTSQIQPEWVDVARVSYFRHTKEGKKDSLKIVYHSPVGKQYPVWCSLDHETSAFAVRKAREWIQAAGATQFTVSDALEEALCDNWRKPTRILVKPDGKFWRVLQAEYQSKVEAQGTLGV